MQALLITNLPINTQYTYYFYNAPNSGTNNISSTYNYYNQPVISHNGASFVNTTNMPTSVGNGWFSLVLTAAEMNYQDNLLYISSINTNVSVTISVWLSTGPSFSELSASPHVTDTLGNKIQAIWQYLMNPRSVTSSTETMYKSDGSTVLSTATISDDGTTFTKGIQ